MIKTDKSDRGFPPGHEEEKKERSSPRGEIGEHFDDRILLPLYHHIKSF